MTARAWVSAPATFKTARSFVEGQVDWFEGTERLQFTGAIAAAVGEDVEVRLELVGHGQTIHATLRVEESRTSRSGAQAQVMARVHAIRPDLRDALERWLRDRPRRSAPTAPSSPTRRDVRTATTPRPAPAAKGRSPAATASPSWWGWVVRAFG